MSDPLRVKRTVERLKSGDRRAGRDVGHSLVKSSSEVLADFRREAVAITPEDAYAEGYRDALLDAVAAYSASLGAFSIDWPKHWKEIYSLLKDPSTPTEVSEFLQLSLPSASRKLKAMMTHGLISVQRGNDSRERRYCRVEEPEGHDGRK